MLLFGDDIFGLSLVVYLAIFCLFLSLIFFSIYSLEISLLFKYIIFSGFSAFSIICSVLAKSFVFDMSVGFSVACNFWYILIKFWAISLTSLWGYLLKTYWALCNCFSGNVWSSKVHFAINFCLVSCWFDSGFLIGLCGFWVFFSEACFCLDLKEAFSLKFAEILLVKLNLFLVNN